MAAQFIFIFNNSTTKETPNYNRKLPSLDFEQWKRAGLCGVHREIEEFLSVGM
jgi:hypothetical protein